MRPEGIEPPAYRFEACRSIHLSYGRVHRSIGRERLTSVVHVNGRHNRIGVLESGVRLDAVSAPICSTIPSGPVAQLAEQQTLNLRVVGSIPTRLTTSRDARRGFVG